MFAIRLMTQFARFLVCVLCVTCFVITVPKCYEAIDAVLEAPEFHPRYCVKVVIWALAATVCFLAACRSVRWLDSTRSHEG
jgi:hypothetical protein